MIIPRLVAVCLVLALVPLGCHSTSSIRTEQETIERIKESEPVVAPDASPGDTSSGRCPDPQRAEVERSVEKRVIEQKPVP